MADATETNKLLKELISEVSSIRSNVAPLYERPGISDDMAEEIADFREVMVEQFKSLADAIGGVALTAGSYQKDVIDALNEIKDELRKTS